ncbi:MAG: RDD family protein, partial [Phycisphaerae bacterium]|nr:RDD family protein [Phycisphaerae bacterium]
PITPVSSVSEPARWWLCASPEAVFVFRSVAGGGDNTRIVCTSWADGAWSEPELIALDGVLDDATAMYVTPRAAFAAATRPPTEPASTPASWRLWRYVDDMWQPGKPLTLTAPPTQAAVAAFGQNVLVADLPADGNVTVGVWPLDGGQATRPPKPIDVFDAPPRPAIDPHVRDWVGTAVLIGIIALVFWRRQDSLSTSLPLPAGTMLGRYWKRLAAALIDLAPAMLATGWFWLGDAQTWLTAAIEYAKEITATGGQVEAYAPPAPAVVIWGWLVTRLAYAMYCGLFEWYWGMTPGKRLLGCRVVGEMGEPPALKQIVLRNAARLLELEMMPTMWPLLLIVFLTRNRQRIGDLLARTVVVEPAPPMPDDHHLDECG